MATKPYLQTHAAFLLAALCLLASSGCTHTAKINVAPTQLPAMVGGGKSPVRTALVLDPEFSDFKYQFKMMGDTFVFPVGPSLTQYARNVVDHVFAQTSVVASAGAVANNVDAILIPKALKADSSQGIWAWDDRNLTLIVEWTLKDGANGNTLWVKPIEGRATETGGNLFTAKGHEKKLFQKLFDDLSLKTFAALSKAPEVRHVGQTQ